MYHGVAVIERTTRWTPPCSDLDSNLQEISPNLGNRPPYTWEHNIRRDFLRTPIGAYEAAGCQSQPSPRAIWSHKENVLMYTTVPTRTRQSAFSLMELLVIVAIVSVLCAALFPVLGRA